MKKRESWPRENGKASSYRQQQFLSRRLRFNPQLPRNPHPNRSRSNPHPNRSRSNRLQFHPYQFRSPHLPSRHLLR